MKEGGKTVIFLQQAQKGRVHYRYRDYITGRVDLNEDNVLPDICDIIG